MVPSLRKWRHDDAGLALAIYSSGSVAAQKLLLQYARAAGGGDGKNQEVEDLRPLFAGRYFDTVNAGLKTQSGSYVKIAEALGLASGQFGRVAFFSDNVKGMFGCFVLRSGFGRWAADYARAESQAALEAGLTPVVVVREGNAPLSAEEQETWKDAIVENFGQVRFE